MLIKKYVADSETNAVMMAKNELGNDAIVMNIKKIQPRGLLRIFVKTKVEVTAAIDDNLSGTTKKTEDNKNSGNNKNSPDDKKSLLPNSNTLDALQKAMENGELDSEDSRNGNKKKDEKKKDISQKEINVETVNDSIESIIDRKIKAELDKEKKLHVSKEDTDENVENDSGDEADLEKKEKLKKLETCRNLIFEQLISAEVTEEYARELLEEVDDMISPDTTINSVLSYIYQKIILKLGQPAQIYSDKGKAAKYIFFVGPTGVGKTTTIAKIVSDLKLNKEANVALITADTYRIAAVEQLKTYAGILDIPVKAVYTIDEMNEAAKDFEEYDYVFVDTAGRSHLNEEQQIELKELIESVDDKDIYLILSITTKYNDLLELTEIYKKIADYKIIFTKLDETRCIGNIYNIRRKTGAQLSYVTNGQNVPDDFSKLDTQYVAKKLLGGKTDGSG